MVTGWRGAALVEETKMATATSKVKNVINFNIFFMQDILLRDIRKF
jgi:hypothetical protein